MEQKNELQAMEEAWESWQDQNGNVYCMETGVRLEFHPNHVAHVLSKGSYSYFRLEKRNMIPLSYEMHQLFDCGSGQKTRKDMKIWPVIEGRIMRLKREYMKYRESLKDQFLERVKETGIIERFGLVPDK